MKERKDARDDDEFLSFMLRRGTKDGGEAFEVILGYDAAKALVAKIKGAIDAKNGVALKILELEEKTLF